MWLCFRLPFGFREVEELLPQHGVIVSGETVRRWCAEFGQAHANGLRRRRPTRHGLNTVSVTGPPRPDTPTDSHALNNGTKPCPPFPSQVPVPPAVRHGTKAFVSPVRAVRSSGWWRSSTVTMLLSSIQAMPALE